MGQTLSEPITTKHTSVSSNSQLRVAVSCMQGWRINMEDAHTQLLSLPGDPTASFFAVFDGHGGATIAQHASHNLHKKLVQQSHYGRGDIEAAFKYSYLQLDRDMATDIHLREDMSGTTAVGILIKNNKIVCANVGDSRAIASVDGAVQELSFDHKPNHELETKRIVAAGGWVEYDRVNGNLALSRALGDFIFKKNERKSAEEQIVTACPDIITKDITAGHEFIVIACDGIWDVMSNEEVLQFVRTRIAQRTEPSTICEALLNTCLAPDAHMGGLGCDNMTVLLICFLNGSSYDNLAVRCAKPVKHSHHHVSASFHAQSRTPTQPPAHPFLRTGSTGGGVLGPPSSNLSAKNTGPPNSESRGRGGGANFGASNSSQPPYSSSNRSYFH